MNNIVRTDYYFQDLGLGRRPLRRSDSSLTYAATASGVVTQLLPILVAWSFPVLAKSFKCEWLMPNWAAASAKEMKRPSSNGLLAHAADCSSHVAACGMDSLGIRKPNLRSPPPLAR
jgi:hypothetical protein